MQQKFKTTVEIDVEIECDITSPSQPPICYDHDSDEFSDCGECGSFEISAIICEEIILNEKIKKQIEKKFFNDLWEEAIDNIEFENDKQDAIREDFKEDYNAKI